MSLQNSYFAIRDCQWNMKRQVENLGAVFSDKNENGRFLLLWLKAL